MKILLWHGYLMSGSGSNVYTLNIANAWRAGGHEVVVMCQARGAAEIPTVDVTADMAEDNLSYEPVATGHPPAAGSCTVVRPYIHGLLPVYVYDDYEGFEVKRFVDLADSELDRYTQANVTAMTSVLRSFAPDFVITGHEVMGPYIAKLACAATGHRYVAKLHGSALEYTVKQDTKRFLPFAAEGLSSAHRVVGGSDYMLEAAASVIPGWRDKAMVVNPGADVELFRRPADKRAGATVAFVGKLIAEKGIHNLLVALGAVRAEMSAVVIVGYGGHEDAISALATALQNGDRERGVEILSTLPYSEAAGSWLATASLQVMQRYGDLNITFTGRLEHGPLSVVLPTFDVLVVPSIVPEAFGMVAAESAACGVLPLVPNHSGISEAGAAIEHHLGRPGLLTFDAADPVSEIARGIDRILGIDPIERDTMGAAASELATELWSWEKVAERLLEAGV
jgi:glycosyltransferase involved in cell wall biosynthesis